MKEGILLNYVEENYIIKIRVKLNFFCNVKFNFIRSLEM